MSMKWSLYFMRLNKLYVVWRSMHEINGLNYLAGIMLMPHYSAGNAGVTLC